MKRTSTALLRRALLLPLALLPFLALNSCAALDFQGAHRESYPQFQISGKPGDLWQNSPGLAPSAVTRPNPTRRQLVAALGEPAKKEQGIAGGGERWIWPTATPVWSGVTILVGLPVPLVLPLDRVGTEVSFGPGDGPALKWIDQTQGEAYVGIGVTPPELQPTDPQLGPFFSHNDFNKRYAVEDRKAYHLKKSRTGGKATWVQDR